MTPAQRADAIQQALLQLGPVRLLAQRDPRSLPRRVSSSTRRHAERTAESGNARVLCKRGLPGPHPARVRQAPPIPFISNLSLNLAIIVRDPLGRILPRVADDDERTTSFTNACIALLFVQHGITVMCGNFGPKERLLDDVEMPRSASGAFFTPLTTGARAETMKNSRQDLFA